MRAVIQRVQSASVDIGTETVASIGPGLLVLLGVAADDKEEDVRWLCSKILQMRIFSDANGQMNLSLIDTGGDMILVSQFTLHALSKKGNRPSFIRAARPETAVPLYELMIRSMEDGLGKKIQTGRFGADMKVSLINDGPVTIIIDSKEEL
jgi:D-tyrosyl-tRNA(Tyr) deacylase